MSENNNDINLLDDELNTSTENSCMTIDLSCDDHYQADYRWSNFDTLEPIYRIKLNVSPYCPEDAVHSTASKDIDNCEPQTEGIINDLPLPCKNEGCPLTEIQLAVYKYGDNWIYVSETDGISIEANDEVMADFFNNLSGFEKQLLNKNSSPLYTNRFKEPQGDLATLRWTNSNYTFPTIYDPNTDDHDSYFIDVENASYSDYIKRLSDLSLVLDELFVDNIWRRLTHEAVKNFDWSYKSLNDDIASDYGVEGGERMHKVMDIIGRVFDDTKFYIDHIKNLNAITYNGLSNTSNIKLNEVDEHLGWEVPSIKEILFQEPVRLSMFGVTLNNDFFEDDDNGITNTAWHNDYYKWFPTIDPESVSPDYCDIQFKRYLALSAKHIMLAKGTTHSIEMINALFGIGDNEISLSNEVKQLSALKVVTPEEIDLIRLWLSYRLTPTYNDDNEFQSIPLKHVSYKVNGEYLDYLLPYFDNNYVYDGNLIYQGDGGWASIDESNEYDETLCYMKNLRNASELMQLNPVNEVTEGEIFHIGTLDNYKYSTMYASHYFVIMEGRSSLPDYIDNWLNIPLKIDSQTNEYLMLTYNEFEDYVDRVNVIRNGNLSATDPDYVKVSYDKSEDGYLLYQSYFRKIQHLSKVINCNEGNNPHTGYGNYDFGEKYFQYMNNPLKYFCDNSDTMDEEILNALKELVLPNGAGYYLADRNIDDINADENIEIKINYV